MNNAVVLTALQVEFQAVRTYLRDLRPVVHPEGTAYDVGTFASAAGVWTVAVVQTGPGNVQAAIEAERAIARFHPSLLLFLGVAGGLKDVTLGDVVAATKVYGYESGKAERVFLTRTEIGESSYDLVQQAMRVARENLWQQRISPMPARAPKAIVAPIAAGEKVVASKDAEVFQLLRQSFSDAAAVEMEGFGVLRAGHANAAVHSLVVRGISDLIEKKTEADMGGSQEMASAHAAAFAFEVLSHLSAPADPPKPPNAHPVSEEGSAWTELESIAGELYSKGPTDSEIWSRADGDISTLDLNLPGRAAWHAALRKLRQGGGGRAVSLNSLLAAMRGDFPNSTALRAMEEALSPGSKLQRLSAQPNIKISAPMVRSDEKFDKGESLPKDASIKVLFLFSNPADTRVLRIDQEIRRIREALKQTRFGARFEFDLRGAVQAGDLQDLFFTSQPDIVQFSGHGTKSSEIILEDETGKQQTVPARALAKLFSLCSTNLRCVILNSCYSESQARAIAEHVDCVIGMSSAIADQAAAHFSRGFFQALGSGTDLQMAFERGRLEMDLLGDDQPGAPVLLSRRPHIKLT